MSLSQKIDPTCHLVFGINGNYQGAAPLFLEQPDIDEIYITKNPVGGLNNEDLDWAKEQGFTHIFDPLADHNHSVPWWTTGRNQPQECAFIHCLPIFDNGKLTLNRWFEPTKGLEQYVALQAFAGSYDPANKKALSPARAQEIVNLIIARGYKVLQLGLPNEPKLDNTTRIESDYFSMVKNVLGCRALVTTDSGIAWCSSCYDFPTLGLYSNSYYSKQYISAIQPINPNAIYLDEDNVNNISLDSIENSLKILL